MDCFIALEGNSCLKCCGLILLTLDSIFWTFTDCNRDLFGISCGSSSNPLQPYLLGPPLPITDPGTGSMIVQRNSFKRLRVKITLEFLPWGFWQGTYVICWSCKLFPPAKYFHISWSQPFDYTKYKSYWVDLLFIVCCLIMLFRCFYTSR